MSFCMADYRGAFEVFRYLLEIRRPAATTRLAARSEMGPNMSDNMKYLSIPYGTRPLAADQLEEPQLW